MDTFESVLARRSAAGVDFMVTGGLAVAMAGFARVTEDVDLLVEASRSNLQRLIDALAGFGQGAAAQLTPADFPSKKVACASPRRSMSISLYAEERRDL